MFHTFCMFHVEYLTTQGNVPNRIQIDFVEDSIPNHVSLKEMILVMYL
jgi:hypothetical protein